MLETSQRIKELDGPVRLRTGTVSGFFRSIEEEMKDKQVPVWDGELYLEFHRGTYTTRGDAKKHNRKSEILYHNAELFSALASTMLGRPYPREELNSGWKLILLNQMHDILPGSTIAEVDLHSRQDYHKVFNTGEDVLGRALEAIGSQVDAPSGGIVIFNPLSWERDDLLRARLTGVSEEFHIVDEGGHVAPHQVLRREGGAAEVLVEARGVPSCGYSTLAIRPGQGPSDESSVSVSQSVLENRFFKVELDGQGRMTSVYDKVARRQVLSLGERGNTLQLFEDKPRDYDAWEIDIYYQDKMREVEGVESVRVLEEGPLRGGVEVRRRFGVSSIVQRIYIYDRSPRINFETEVDWHERHALLKVAFPVEVRSTRATYEIQFGSVERPTHWNTSWDWARFEVYAHKWADLSEGDYGVSLLNDCKYGHDIRDNVMRLTLLKSPAAPDPHSDEGHHQFTYSLYPHKGDWRGGTIRQGYELNNPLIYVQTGAHGGPLPKSFSLVGTDRENVIVETIKVAEDSDDLILRCYESHNQRGDVALRFGLPIENVFECNLLEEDRRRLKTRGDSALLHVTPFQVRTVGARLKRADKP